METLDITNCDREPIHIPGSVQGHGFVIVVDEFLIITHCSENLNGFIDRAPSSILGESISWIEKFLHTSSTGPFLANIIHAAKTGNGLNAKNPYRVEINGKPFNLIVTKSADFLFLEFEPNISGLHNMRFDLGSSISEILSVSDLNSLYNRIAVKIKEIISFDRVMVYKFHEDGHGQVIAEAKNKDLKPWLGLHFPASDIPKQARELYKVNLTRLIANVFDTPARLLSILDPTRYPLDMTQLGLRAVSPIHIQYLKNMEVASSFSISLLNSDKLWGLVACHNYTPRFIHYENRETAKIIGQVLSSAISFREIQEDEHQKLKLKLKVDELAKQLSRTDSPADALIKQSVTILDAVDATGAVLIYDKQILCLGETPALPFIEDLIKWLETSNVPNVFETDRLPTLFDAAVLEKNKASGLLACRINRELREYILWFRPEYLVTIQWAGNPEKPVSIDKANNPQMSPRSSFDAWSDTRKLTSSPWKPEDMNSAAELRDEITFKINRKASELRELNEKLKIAYDNLDSFSYTISHDLKNPLSSIHGFSEYLLNEDPSPDETKMMLERILLSARKMNSMINDILSYSQAGRASREFSLLNMGKILEEIKQELIIGDPNRDIEIRIEEAPPFFGDETMITQVFSNLIGNAVKYSTESANPVVVVNGQRSMDGVRYEIKDNGIGIPKRDTQKIFDLFSRSEHARNFEGNGVGLAIVKKLVEKHRGKIWVESQQDVGSTFFVLFTNDTVDLH